MKLKELRKVFSQYQLTNIYENDRLIYSNDVLQTVPKEIDDRKVKNINVISDKVYVYLEKKKMEGFTFPYGQKTVFVETPRKYRTEGLAVSILREMKLPVSKVYEVLYRLERADCEVKQLSNGTDWYSMSGKKFTESGPLNGLIHIRVA